jgi:hypothetical protein
VVFHVVAGRLTQSVHSGKESDYRSKGWQCNCHPNAPRNAGETPALRGGEDRNGSRAADDEGAKLRTLGVTRDGRAAEGLLASRRSRGRWSTEY